MAALPMGGKGGSQGWVRSADAKLERETTAHVLYDPTPFVIDRTNPTDMDIKGPTSRRVTLK
jgi:hypothetical protein